MTFEKLLQQSLLWRGLYFITILLVNVMLSRYLHADGAGWIYYLTNFFSLILLVASLSMESGYTYYASGNIISQHQLAWFSLVWTTVIAIVTSATLWFYFNHFKSLSRQQTNQYVLYGITYVAGILLVNFYTVLFYAQKNYWLPNLLMVAVNLAFIGLIFLYRKDEGAYNTIVAAYFISILIQGIILAIAFIKANKSILHFSLPNSTALKLLLRYSLVALAGNLIFFFVYRIDYWFVRYNTASCSEADLGNYIQASKLGQMLLIIPQIFASVIFPQTASGNLRTDVNKSIFIFLRVFLQVMFIGAVVVALIGDWVFPFVFGQSFNNVTIPLIWLIPGIFSLSVLTLLSAYFSGKGKVKVNVIGGILALITVIVGDIIFIPIKGIYAAAAVSSFAYTTNLLYAIVVFCKDYNLGLKDILSFSLNDWYWIKNMLLSKTVE